jgi:hypothetical protein
VCGRPESDRHLEFLPTDAPDPDAQIGVPAEQITTELLELCEEFLRQASPTVHTELRQFLTEHGHHGGLGWFLDALGFTVLNCAFPDNNPGSRATVSGEQPCPNTEQAERSVDAEYADQPR